MARRTNTGKYSVSAVAQKKGAAVPGGAIKLSGDAVTKNYKVQNAARQAGARVGRAVGAIGANKGKAGLALGALAAAGGLGMAGMKAMKKPKSLQDRLKGAAKKNSMLSQASKMFR